MSNSHDVPPLLGIKLTHISTCSTYVLNVVKYNRCYSLLSGNNTLVSDALKELLCLSPHSKRLNVLMQNTGGL